MTILRGQDMSFEELRDVLQQASWPPDAWVLLEGARGITFTPLGDSLGEPLLFERGRVFWSRGEVKWQVLGESVWRVVYQGEDDFLDRLPALDDVLRRAGNLRPSSRGVILRGVRTIDFGSRLNPSDKTIFLKMSELIDESGEVAFSRLAEVAAE